MTETKNSNMLNPEEILIEKDIKSTDDKSGESKSPTGGVLDLHYKAFGGKNSQIYPQENEDKSPINPKNPALKKANLVAGGATQLPEPLLEENPNRFVILPIQYPDVWKMYKD